MADTIMSRGRIFISYRRDETAYPAGWLFDRLTQQFGSGQVFKDVNSIEPGDDFVQAITQAVASCDVLLAVIGQEWLTIRDENGQRLLDNPEDFLRVEIESALARNIRVIPVLVDEARMPRVSDLPASLAGLTRRQATRLSAAQFDLDTGRLLAVLDSTLAELGTGQRGTAQQGTEEPGQRHREQEPAAWKAELISRSKAEVVLRLHAGPRQHFIKFNRNLGKDTLSINGEVVLKESEFSQANIPITDGYGQITLNFKLTKGRTMELTESAVNGLSWGLVRRVGPVRITVDNLIVFEG